MNNEIILEDTTLRDGEQAPGLSFNKKAKIEIYKALVDLGVKWMEIGIPAMKGEELVALNEIKDMAVNDKVNVIAWNRGVRSDVELSLSLGFRAIHIGLPTSDIHLKDSIKKDRNWLLNQAKDLIKFAKDHGAFVSISAEDVGRTNLDFLKEYAAAVSEAGADRLRLSDTIGILMPQQYAHIIKSLRAVSNIDLQSHAHNDFGLAVINTIAALEAGARYFHVTVNGIGERAGMPDLAQVVTILHRFYNIDLNLDHTKLTSVANLVSKNTHTSLYPWHSVVGENVFAHESGIHANGTLNNANTFEPFSPQSVGGKRRIVIGKHSGRNAIKHVLESEFDLRVNESFLEDCLSKVRSRSMEKQSALASDEVLRIYNSLLEKGSNEVLL